VDPIEVRDAGGSDEFVLSRSMLCVIAIEWRDLAPNSMNPQTRRRGLFLAPLSALTLALARQSLERSAGRTRRRTQGTGLAAEPALTAQ